MLKKGRKTRLFTGATRAAVIKRDRGTCIFPGCTHTKWVDVHHINHWSRGGLSDPENGAVLCDFHHRLVHEGGYSLDHDFVFRTPEGHVVPPKPPITQAPDRCPIRWVKHNACVSRGNGGRFDLADTVTCMIQRSEKAQAV